MPPLRPELSSKEHENLSSFGFRQYGTLQVKNLGETPLGFNEFLVWGVIKLLGVGSIKCDEPWYDLVETN